MQTDAGSANLLLFVCVCAQGAKAATSRLLMDLDRMEEGGGGSDNEGTYFLTHLPAPLCMLTPGPLPDTHTHTAALPPGWCMLKATTATPTPGPLLLPPPGLVLSTLAAMDSTALMDPLIRVAGARTLVSRSVEAFLSSLRGPSHSYSLSHHHLLLRMQGAHAPSGIAFANNNIVLLSPSKTAPHDNNMGTCAAHRVSSS